MSTAHREAQGGVVALTISALGVVFGDIGTSPLYALKECVSPEHGFVQNRSDLLGVLSLIFWSLMLVVTFKYLMFVMRAHNRGEGGIFALLALMPERMWSPDGVRIGGLPFWPCSALRCSAERA
jgi:KUP system potassium uptake protein